MGMGLLAGIGLAGAAVSGYGSYKAAKEQKKASREAAAAAKKAADKAAVVTQSGADTQTVDVQANSERSVQRAERRRFSIDDTVNMYTQSGLRRTLN